MKSKILKKNDNKGVVTKLVFQFVTTPFFLKITHISGSYSPLYTCIILFFRITHHLFKSYLSFVMPLLEFEVNYALILWLGVPWPGFVR